MAWETGWAGREAGLRVLEEPAGRERVGGVDEAG